MITMDLKGITWVGNIYQKFEAMCLEVEEVMYKDAVEYVENQVQTVGASVKKFYSDVVQDLLPPSSIDPVKVAAADLSLNPYADFGIYKKPKKSIKNDTVKINKQLTEDSKVIAGGKNTEYSSSFGGLHTVDHFQPPSVGSVKGAGLECCLDQNKCRVTYEHSNVPFKRKSRRNNHLPSEMPRSITPLSKDLNGLSSCHEIRDNHEVVCDWAAVISRSHAVDVTGCASSGAKICNIAGSAVTTADTSLDTPTSDTILLVGSGAKKEVELRCTSSNSDVLSAELNGRAGDYNLVMVENDNLVIKPGMETIEQVDESKLEETCVLVDRTRFYRVVHREDRPKSYKKKIQKAFLSKRSARKQEYEKLALQQGDMDAGSNQESAESLMHAVTMDADTKKPPPYGVCEFEWELL